MSMMNPGCWRSSRPSGLLQSWKPRTDCRAWEGISCQPDNGTRVNSISPYRQPDKPNGYLSVNNKLSGQLSANIGNLTQLQAIGLAGNKFTSIIPKSRGANESSRTE
ncbi:hypothetical protein Ancab_038485 [Ancistrocladus abbreviatus]